MHSQQWKLIFLNIFLESFFLYSSASAADCPMGTLFCDESKCIEESDTCDSIPHCDDGRDERGCECLLFHYMVCEQDRECYPPEKHCDSTPDCADGSDERGCPIDLKTTEASTTSTETSTTSIKTLTDASIKLTEATTAPTKASIPLTEAIDYNFVVPEMEISNDFYSNLSESTLAQSSITTTETTTALTKASIPSTESINYNFVVPEMEIPNYFYTILSESTVAQASMTTTEATTVLTNASIPSTEAFVSPIEATITPMEVSLAFTEVSMKSNNDDSVSSIASTMPLTDVAIASYKVYKPSTDISITSIEASSAPIETSITSTEASISSTEKSIISTGPSIAPTKTSLTSPEVYITSTDFSLTSTEASKTPTETSITSTDGTIAPTEAPITSTEASIASTRTSITSTETHITLANTSIAPADASKIPTEATKISISVSPDEVNSTTVLVECGIGTFQLFKNHVNGCQKCFCMNTNSTCTSSKMKRKKMYVKNKKMMRLGTRRRKKKRNRSKHPKTNNKKKNSKMVQSFELTKYLKGGDKVSSYGAAIRLETWNIDSSSPAFLQLQGNGLVLRQSQNVQEKRRNVKWLQILVFALDGGLWERLKGGRKQKATRADLLTVLANLDSITLKAIIKKKHTTLHVKNLSMGYAIYDSKSNNVANEIEFCNCPEGYEGSSCQRCAQGYEKVEESFDKQDRLHFNCKKKLILNLTFNNTTKSYWARHSILLNKLLPKRQEKKFV